MYYYCKSSDSGPRRTRWMMQAHMLDQPISEAFLNRLRRSKVEYDPAVYEQQAAARLAETQQVVKLLEAQRKEIQ